MHIDFSGLQFLKNDMQWWNIYTRELCHIESF